MQVNIVELAMIQLIEFSFFSNDSRKTSLYSVLIVYLLRQYDECNFANDFLFNTTAGLVKTSAGALDFYTL